MAKLPYVKSPGNVKKALDAIISASTPPRVSQDFVKTVLKIPSGSGNQIASYLKKIGLVNVDSAPSENYKKFRNEATRGKAAADILRIGYAPLYQRNEYMHKLADSKLRGLIIEVTGAGKDSSTIQQTLSCIKHIRSFASFDPEAEFPAEHTNTNSITATDPDGLSPDVTKSVNDVGLNLSYTINLNLPATSDIAVFNAIFKSLKDNLLRGSNG